MDSQIIRVTSGALNTVNDSYIGGQPAGAGTTDSMYAGQLGKTVWYEPDMIAQMFDSSIGTLYAGRYRYVRLRSADTPVPVVGQILFWDTTVTNWQSAYQVTREEDLSSVDNAIFIAGIYLGGLEAGNYGFIQDLGNVNIKFRAVLTSTGQIGSRCYAAGAGDGADEGFADVLNTADPATIGDTGLMQARYLGNAITAPVATELDTVDLRFNNILG